MSTVAGLLASTTVSSAIADPIPSVLHTASKSEPPLVVSGTLPPIPAKVMDKVRSGQYVDFKELLPDNVALLEQIKKLGTSPAPAASHLREIKDGYSAFCTSYRRPHRSQSPSSWPHMARLLSTCTRSTKGQAGWLTIDCSASKGWPLCALCGGSDHDRASCASTQPLPSHRGS